jgi:hypothetical protein
MNELLNELAEVDAVSKLRGDYFKTLALLRALKAGRVLLDQVTMTADGWQIGATDDDAPSASAEKDAGEPEPAE